MCAATTSVDFKIIPPKPVFGTFGTYRILLAIMVVLAHVGPATRSHYGIQAVFAFYILSGYVVSYILVNTYLPRPNGLRKYAVNRALRIFPPYLVTVAFTLLLISDYPQQAAFVSYYMGYPLPTVESWLSTLSTLWIANPITGRLSSSVVLPVAWSLQVEMFYWALIPILLTSARARRCLVWIAVVYTAAVVLVTLHRTGESQRLRYWAVLAASPAFYLGMQIYRNKHWIESLVIPRLKSPVIVIAMPCLFYLLDRYADHSYAGFYGMIVFNACAIAGLSNVTLDKLPGCLRNTDTALGNLAYPLYLLHEPAAVLVHALCPMMPLQSWTYFGITMAISLPASAVLHHIVELPVNYMKTRVIAGN